MTSRSASLLLVALVVAACGTTAPSPTPSIEPSPSPSPAPVVASQVCVPPTEPVSPAYAGDPCPGAFTAIRAAVAGYAFPIRRIYVEAGIVACGVLWPPATGPMCSEPAPIAGRDMRGWVSFVGTAKVAAVALERPLVFHDPIPAPSPMPWTAEVLAFMVPPSGWEMP